MCNIFESLNLNKVLINQCIEILDNNSPDKLNIHLTDIKRQNDMFEVKAWQHILSGYNLSGTYNNFFVVLMKHFPDEAIKQTNLFKPWVFERYPDICTKHIIHIATYHDIPFEYFKSNYHRFSESELKYVIGTGLFPDCGSMREYLLKQHLHVHLPVGDEVVARYPLKLGHMLVIKNNYVSLCTIDSKDNRQDYKDHSLYIGIENKYVSKFICDTLVEYKCQHLFDHIQVNGFTCTQLVGFIDKLF